MEQIDKKQSDFSKHEVDMIKYLQNQYGLDIMLKSKNSSDLNNALYVLEKTQIGKSLFIKISMLMKMHTECIFLLTSNSNHHSEMNDEKIILHINFDDVNNEKFIYICQKETDFGKSSCIRHFGTRIRPFDTNSTKNFNLLV